MANTVKLKRSATPAQAPTTGQLDLGEVAINTYDGKMYIKKDDGTASIVEIGAGGSGTVTSVSVSTANGVSGSVATATTTPAITLTLGAITPSSVASTGAVTGTNLSGTNTGDQTITLTGDVTGTGTGSFATTLGTVPATKGGTGQTTITTGDVLYGSATNTISKLGIGSAGQVLTVAGGVPTWAAAGGGGATLKSYKEAVLLATTANITLSGNVTVDGVTSAAGNRILVKNQSTASQNGIYVASASAWSLAADFDTSGDEVANGCIIPVQFGTVNGGSTWQLVQNGGTIGNSFKFSPIGGMAGYGQAGWTQPVASNTDALAIGNTASASGTSSVAIGKSATASGAANPIAIGNSASGTGTNSIVIGDLAAGSADRAIAIGRTSNNSGARSLCIGFAATNSGGFGVVNVGASCNTGGADRSGGIVIGNSSSLGSMNSAAFGTSNSSDMAGEFSFGFGGFTSAGDARASTIVARMTTTDATLLELGVFGVSPSSGLNSTAPAQRIVLVNDSSYIFDCDIIARNTATDTETSGWNLKFVIRRGAAAANTAIVGSATKTVIGQDSGTTGWDVTVSADTTNGRPNIAVTGQAAKTIRWVANIRLTKVSG